eukprot:GHVT01087738.1.p1 GENE.GHVT01087738.1~~GHVT01087738.1.p1  ORF type:complete len:1244 (+),score=255.23 GHVT01087738.1:426-3734(+)
MPQYGDAANTGRPPNLLAQAAVQNSAKSKQNNRKKNKKAAPAQRQVQVLETPNRNEDDKRESQVTYWHAFYHQYTVRSTHQVEAMHAFDVLPQNSNMPFVLRFTDSNIYPSSVLASLDGLEGNFRNFPLPKPHDRTATVNLFLGSSHISELADVPFDITTHGFINMIMAHVSPLRLDWARFYNLEGRPRNAGVKAKGKPKKKKNKKQKANDKAPLVATPAASLDAAGDAAAVVDAPDATAADDSLAAAAPPAAELAGQAPADKAADAPGRRLGGKRRKKKKQKRKKKQKVEDHDKPTQEKGEDAGAAAKDLPEAVEELGDVEGDAGAASEPAESGAETNSPPDEAAVAATELEAVALVADAKQQVETLEEPELAAETVVVANALETAAVAKPLQSEAVAEAVKTAKPDNAMEAGEELETAELVAAVAAGETLQALESEAAERTDKVSASFESAEKPHGDVVVDAVTEVGAEPPATGAIASEEAGGASVEEGGAPVEGIAMEEKLTNVVTSVENEVVVAAGAASEKFVDPLVSQDAANAAADSEAIRAAAAAAATCVDEPLTIGCDLASLLSRELDLVLTKKPESEWGAMDVQTKRMVVTANRRLKYFPSKRNFSDEWTHFILDLAYEQGTAPSMMVFNVPLRWTAGDVTDSIATALVRDDEDVRGGSGLFKIERDGLDIHATTRIAEIKDYRLTLTWKDLDGFEAIAKLSGTTCFLDPKNGVDSARLVADQTYFRVISEVAPHVRQGVMDIGDIPFSVDRRSLLEFIMRHAHIHHDAHQRFSFCTGMDYDDCEDLTQRGGIVPALCKSTQRGAKLFVLRKPGVSLPLNALKRVAGSALFYSFLLVERATVTDKKIEFALNIAESNATRKITIQDVPEDVAVEDVVNAVVRQRLHVVCLDPAQTWKYIEICKGTPNAKDESNCASFLPGMYMSTALKLLRKTAGKTELWWKVKDDDQQGSNDQSVLKELRSRIPSYEPPRLIYEAPVSQLRFIVAGEWSAVNNIDSQLPADAVVQCIVRIIERYPALYIPLPAGMTPEACVLTAPNMNKLCPTCERPEVHMALDGTIGEILSTYRNEPLELDFRVRHNPYITGAERHVCTVVN